MNSKKNDFTQKIKYKKILWGTLITLMFLIVLFVVIKYFNHDSIATIKNLY